MTPDHCSVLNCSKKVLARGLCGDLEVMTRHQHTKLHHKRTPTVCPSCKPPVIKLCAQHRKEDKLKRNAEKFKHRRKYA